MGKISNVSKKEGKSLLFNVVYWSLYRGIEATRIGGFIL